VFFKGYIMLNLYQEELMDHYRYPRNHGQLPHPDFTSGQFNPSCGDKVAIQGCIEGQKLTQLAFEGAGCVISLATASMLTEQVKDKSLEDINKLDKDFILGMIGMSLGPTRLKCALLPLEALKTGIKNYQADKGI
jgi:nitrogen fixation protein NifU and related proteins